VKQLKTKQILTCIDNQANATSISAGFRGDPRGPGLGPPPKRAPTMFMSSAIYATYACHLVVFSEKSLFVDAVNLSVGQTAVFHWKNS